MGEGARGRGRGVGMGVQACGWCAARLLNVAAALLLGVGLPAPAPVPCAAPRPCAPRAPSALCLCRADHLSCTDVPFYRFPETEVGVRHVSVGGARLGALGEAALDARALRTLVLVGSRLHHIETRAFASMASTLASLDLGYNEFTELPIEALRELKVLNWLNLQNNLIMDLEVDIDWGFLADSLSTLSLSNNQLRSLDEGSLRALRHLTQLDLDGNRLHAVREGALPPSLAVLRLADNLLTRAPCAALARLPRLQHLHLRNNMLHPSSNGTCRVEHTKIDSLDLSSNELDDRFESIFQGALQLKQLVLDLNEFTSIPTFVGDNGRLQKLSLSYNKIGRISDAAVRSLKRDLERLDLDHNELTAIPESVSELLRLRHLSLAYNQLVELDHLPRELHSLSLAGNYFLALPTSALRALAPATLTYLDIGYNQISALAQDSFGAWSEALATLNLKGNRITQLSAEVFPATLPLRELVLSFNDLYYVDSNTFANLTLLKGLELSSTLFNGEFPITSALDTLSWLSLDNNNIHYVSSEDLLNFSSLEYLNLDFNKILEFPSEAIVAVRSHRLKELRLAYNYISKIKSVFFTNIPELEILDLSYNRLQNITEHSFINLPNLLYLNLAGNLLDSVASGAFRHLPNLEMLDLHGNRLTEFTTEYFENVSNEETNFSVNASYNMITAVHGGEQNALINILDLSHNLLETLSKAFFESVGSHLRQLILSHNRLVQIDGFAATPNLVILDLRRNNISAMKKKYFSETTALQVVDLSHNTLTQLSVEQFHNMRRLRHLHLNNNELRSLPRDSFKNTILEHLDLSDNQLTIFPSSALAQVGFTLRRLELAFNRLEYLDTAMFQAIAFLQELSLGHNALTVLSDNTFAGLPRLRRLDLSHNTVKTNFKELFHNLPRLRYLSLAGCGLKTVPNFLLTNLTELDISGNHITSYREVDFRRLTSLRVLLLAENKFTSLQPAMWAGVRRLTYLDVSHNPIVRLTRSSFEGLERLLSLSMHHLRYLEAVEPRAFRSLCSLRRLELESPLVAVSGRPDTSLADVTAATPALEVLILYVRESVLDRQLHGVRAAKLRELEVSGATMTRVAAHAFASLGRQRALAVRLTGTKVRALPAGLLRPLARVPHLGLDLTNNRIETFGPATLYPNLTGWNRLATKLLPGGLALSSNPLRCGCAVAWVGAWLRRWTAEVGEGGAGAREAARTTRCLVSEGASATVSVPLLVVAPDEAECHASALSSRAPPASAPASARACLVLVLHALLSS